MDSNRPTLPAHIEDTVRSIAELHAEHDRQASLYQRAIERLIEQLSRPIAVAVACTMIGLWIGTNIAFSRLHMAPFDPPPFSYLQGVVAAGALFMTLLILTSQRRNERLSERRTQVTLELTMVSEQKLAKLIELVEQQRRDNPQISNRIDDEAAAMAKPANSQAIFEAIQETHSAMVAGDESEWP
jgi:uncharacterized membrane protein